jgi:hypothetical protein
MVQRRVFQTPATAPEMASEAVAEPADEVSAPADAEPNAKPVEMPQDAPTDLAGESIEAGPADVTPVPESALQRAQAAMAGNDADIARLVTERNGLLVRDEVDEAAIAHIDDELAQRQRRQRTLSDRLALLAAEARRAEAEQAAQVHEAKIIEAERLFISRDAAVMDLRDHLVAAEQAYRKVYELGVAARAAWPWEHGRAGGTLTAAHDLTREVSSFLYRIGGRPAQLGGQFPTNVPPSFPGAKCPKIELLQLPDKLPDLAAEYRLASKYASDVMRGLRVDAVPTPSATSGLHAVASFESPTSAPASPGVTGQSDSIVIAPLPTVSPFKAVYNPELSKILERQNALASRAMSDADEREYQENCRMIQELSA